MRLFDMANFLRFYKIHPIPLDNRKGESAIPFYQNKNLMSIIGKSISPPGSSAGIPPKHVLGKRIGATQWLTRTDF